MWVLMDSEEEREDGERGREEEREGGEGGQEEKRGGGKGRREEERGDGEGRREEKRGRKVASWACRSVGYHHNLSCTSGAFSQDGSLLAVNFSKVTD